MHSWVTPSFGLRLKSVRSSSIGPKVMGKGLGPSTAQFRTIWPTMSIICCWEVWFEICCAICRELRRERSRAHCFSRGRNSRLSECGPTHWHSWVFVCVRAIAHMSSGALRLLCAASLHPGLEYIWISGLPVRGSCSSWSPYDI